MIEKIKASPSYVKVIPAVGQVQAVLMAYFHGSRAHGHLGYKRTLDIMQRVVYWDGMAGEVRRFVKACWCMKDGRYNLRTLKAPPAHIALVGEFILLGVIRDWVKSPKSVELPTDDIVM